MESWSLRALSGRCLAAARECFDLHAKREFREIADELTRKADELDRFGHSFVDIRRGSGESREGQRDRREQTSGRIVVVRGGGGREEDRGGAPRRASSGEGLSVLMPARLKERTLEERTP